MALVIGAISTEMQEVVKEFLKDAKAFLSMGIVWFGSSSTAFIQALVILGFSAYIPEPSEETLRNPAMADRARAFVRYWRVLWMFWLCAYLVFGADALFRAHAPEMYSTYWKPVVASGVGSSQPDWQHPVTTTALNAVLNAVSLFGILCYLQLVPRAKLPRYRTLILLVGILVITTFAEVCVCLLPGSMAVHAAHVGFEYGTLIPAVISLALLSIRVARDTNASMNEWIVLQLYIAIQSLYPFLGVNPDLKTIAFWMALVGKLFLFRVVARGITDSKVGLFADRTQ